MILAAEFNPLLTSSGSFNAPTLSTGSKMIVINKSYVDIQFTFGNSFNPIVPANDRRQWTFSSNLQVANGVVQWNILNIDYPQFINQLLNVVYVEVYDPSEPITETYPVPLQRTAVPSLFPANNGSGPVKLTTPTPAGTTFTIYPTSYQGITTAPSSKIYGGESFNHFYPAGAKDTVVGGTDGTLVNGVLTSFQAGPFSLSGLGVSVDTSYFYNNGSYITLPYNLNLAGATNFVIDTWINVPQGAPTIAQPFTIVADDNPGSSGKGFFIQINSDATITYQIARASGYVQFKSSPISFNVWHYVEILWSGTTLYAVLDNQIIGSLAVSTNNFVNSTSGSTNIGRNPVTLANTFLGNIADVGFCLSGPLFPTPIFRYNYGLSAQNYDIFNAWISGFDITTGTNATAANFTFSFANIYNPGGKLFLQNLTSPSQLPAIGTTLTYQIGVPTIGGMGLSRTFPSPLTQLSFVTPITFTDWSGSTPPGYNLNIYGWNLLGIA